jgi:hypothetical protein
MHMFIPKKLVEHKFSYPKRRIKKNTLEVHKENEVAEEHQKPNRETYQINPKMEINQHQEEDFWVDCNK